MKILSLRQFVCNAPQKCCCNILVRHSWNVLFFGSDEFSLYSLKKLNNAYNDRKIIQKLDITTTMGATANSVKKFADKNNLKVLRWPPSLDETDTKLYDIGIVVSFGHLIPKKIIEYFPLGVINVHASLLPRWRGACPIIHSIINGDTETGVSIMQINPHHFDTGDIILQKSCPIGKDELMPSVFERLGNLGAIALLDTMSNLRQCLDRRIPQNSLHASSAPKINASIANVDWNKNAAVDVYNKFRALYSIYELRTSWHGVTVKLKKLRIASNYTPTKEHIRPGTVLWCRQSKELRVACLQGQVLVESLSIGGKVLRSNDFFNGYLTKKMERNWIFE